MDVPSASITYSTQASWSAWKQTGERTRCTAIYDRHDNQRRNLGCYKWPREAHEATNHHGGDQRIQSPISVREDS